LPSFFFFHNLRIYNGGTFQKQKEGELRFFPFRIIVLMGLDIYQK